MKKPSLNLPLGKLKSFKLSPKTGLFVSLAIFVASLAVLNNTLGPQPAHVASTPHVSAASQSQPVINGHPNRLQIPSLGLDLPIVDGYYNAKTKEWTLSRDKVQFATVTPDPNNKAGSTFLYGHYRREVFASLHKIQADADAIVTTDNGHTFYYKLNYVKVVKPDQIAGIFTNDGKPILTIQTCTGSFFQDRQLFVFDFVKVD